MTDCSQPKSVSNASERKELGRVKWFNNTKGFGFIVEDSGNEDLFAHYSQINSDGFKSLRAGQQVRFNKVCAGKGFHAHNIELVDETCLVLETDPA